MTCANQFLAFGIDNFAPNFTYLFSRMDLSLFKSQLELDKTDDFAISHFLYLLKYRKYAEKSLNLSLDLVQLLFQSLHSSQRLAKVYGSSQ